MSLREICPLGPEKYSQARAALGRAFFTYDLMVYAAADEKRRAAGVTSLYGAILSDAYRYGEVQVTGNLAGGNLAGGDLAGVACWLPPGKEIAGFTRQVRSGMLALPFRFGVRAFQRLLTYGGAADYLHHTHAAMPHWFLAAIGVEPKYQGQGVGSHLIRPMLDRADSAGLHCYLDTHREQNVKLYQRHGFEIAERMEVPGHPVPVWGMLRKPR